MKNRLNLHSIWVLALIAIFSAHTSADDAVIPAETDPAIADQDQAMEQVRKELDEQERRWYTLMRIRTHSVQIVSAGFGGMLSKQQKHADCSLGCELSGWHFEVEPGLYGVQAGIGWGTLVGETGGTKRLLHTVHFGWNVRGVVLRTYGDNALFPNEQTLVGVEGNLSIIRLNFSVGVMRSLYEGPGEEFGSDWRITTGIGWGF